MGKRAVTAYIKSVWVLNAFEECEEPFPFCLSTAVQHGSTPPGRERQTHSGGKCAHSVERLFSAGLSRGESVLWRHSAMSATGI